MKKEENTRLKEIRSHGTKTFPCAVYRTSSEGQGVMVKHHWHDEVEMLYFDKGGFLLEVNMEVYPVESECICFINPGELHSITKICSEESGEDAIVFHPAVLSFESYDAAQMELLQPIQLHAVDHELRAMLPSTGFQEMLSLGKYASISKRS